MDKHPLDRPVGSDLSYECFKLRQRTGELATPKADSTLRHLYPITAGCERHAFIADREPVVDSFQGETPKFISER